MTQPAEQRKHEVASPPRAALRSPTGSGGDLVLYLLVFVGGAITMGTEMCASRLLAPHCGTSLPVWGLLIGLLLTYLAIGSWAGGTLADLRPEASLLYRLAAWAGFFVGCVPFVSRPVLRLVAGGLGSSSAGTVVGVLLGMLALFALPVTLLGCISPFALRLCLKDRLSGGNVAGRVSALSTLGSLLGTFGTVFWLIPTLGTRLSLFVLALGVLLVAIIGLLKTAPRRGSLLYLILVVVLLVLQLIPPGAIKDIQGLIYEQDTAYNYLQVIQDGEEILLKLNEGEGIQSTYRPGRIISGYVFDYFLLVPFFRTVQPSSWVSSLCLIGLAGGTSAQQYSAVFGAIPIDGVEIDPAVAEAGRRFMGLNLPNLNVVIADGRYYLTHSEKRYDVILLDAYNPPYIPFHLTTAEFFQQVHDHQTENGVLGINVARVEADSTLVSAIATTVRSVYPSVYVMETQGGQNSVVVASRQPGDMTTITARLASLTDPVLSDVAARANGRIREAGAAEAFVLTDDHAPVESMVHAMIARYILHSLIPR